jgi:hypothetical protein
MTMRHAQALVSPVLLCLLLVAGPAVMAAGGWQITWWTVDGGGTFSQGSGFRLAGTSGQPDSGVLEGGGYRLTGGFWSRGGIPTAVTLASFSALPFGSTILVEWETASEVSTLGYNLYQAQDLEGERIRLNSDLILSQVPGSPAGTTYRFVDEMVVPGTTYYYWLEDVGVHGGGTLHGPVSATAGPYNSYLPLVYK